MSNAVTRVTLTGPHLQAIDGVTHSFGPGRVFVPAHVAEAARAAGLVDEGEPAAVHPPAAEPTPAPPAPKRVRKPRPRKPMARKAPAAKRTR